MTIQTLHLNYQIHAAPESLNPAQRQLIEIAFEAAGQAYAPYSHYQVGAALLLEDGTVLKANNQENASYPCGICAERNVLYYYGANFKNLKITKIAISTKLLNVTIEQPPAPCGLCRQVMGEFERNNAMSIEILLGQPGKMIYLFHSCNDLLPFGFHPDFLLAK